MKFEYIMKLPYWKRTEFLLARGLHLRGSELLMEKVDEVFTLLQLSLDCTKFSAKLLDLLWELWVKG